jgi:hypothetical protein
MKEGGAAVAADNDVVEGAGEVHARFASHRGTLQETTHINQYSCLTPFPDSAAMDGCHTCIGDGCNQRKGLVFYEWAFGV